MNPDRIFADTNLFLRYLTDDVSHQADAVETLLRRAATGEITLVTNSLVIAEIVWVLETVYRLPRPSIAEKVLAILNTPGLEVGEAEVLLQAIVWYTDQGVDFADAYHGAWMLAHGISVAYTFDRRHFRRIPGITVLHP
ncbi:MAG: type II toxin-antitoxin system VapC family toxin [Anaerolineae bacterium]|nr:type II toxin-antitoxin system VapC family toxin [Anaerolineae bacterium]MCX8068217.1 type II toxin-antitoxin system VapC family toxin [Anaerolineae bacterium]MDW7990627.1 type II toxin-antitoxin system VapC family toxin [Anaerolineae bacterium]